VELPKHQPVFSRKERNAIEIDRLSTSTYLTDIKEELLKSLVDVNKTVRLPKNENKN